MPGGNFRWLSPELLDPDNCPSPSGRPRFASDIYSFACVCIEVRFPVLCPHHNTFSHLLQLYTDQAPFAADLMETQVPIRVLRGSRPPRPIFFDGELMDDGLWEIVQSCWKQNPSERPDAEQLVAKISAILWSALDLD